MTDEVSGDDARAAAAGGSTEAPENVLLLVLLLLVVPSGGAMADVAVELPPLNMPSPPVDDDTIMLLMVGGVPSAAGVDAPEPLADADPSEADDGDSLACFSMSSR